VAASNLKEMETRLYGWVPLVATHPRPGFGGAGGYCFVSTSGRCPCIANIRDGPPGLASRSRAKIISDGSWRADANGLPAPIEAAVDREGRRMDAIRGYLSLMPSNASG